MPNLGSCRLEHRKKLYRIFINTRMVMNFRNGQTGLLSKVPTTLLETLRKRKRQVSLRNMNSENFIALSGGYLGIRKSAMKNCQLDMNHLLLGQRAGW